MEAENMLEGAIRRCRGYLHTVPLDATSWLVLLAIGIASMFLIKVNKWISITGH
jgi:hypothetical protein